MRRIILFLVAFILWLLLAWTLHWQSLVAGLGVAFLTALVFGHLWGKEHKKYFQLKRYFWFLVYLRYFLDACVRANLDVAYRVLHPRMPIKPGIVKVKTNLKTDIAKTCLANSITMTPGTLSVDIQDEYLYIHWIYVYSPKTDEATRIIVERFEKLLARVFE